MPGFSLDWINKNIATYGGIATLLTGERVPVTQVRRVEYIREGQLEDGSWQRIEVVEWDMDFSYYTLKYDEIG